MHNQEHGLTSLLTVYGEAPLNEPTLMLGYSTLMPHLIDIRHAARDRNDSNDLSPRSSLKYTVSQ